MAKNREKDDELLLLSFLFITGVFFAKRCFHNKTKKQFLINRNVFILPKLNL